MFAKNSVLFISIFKVDGYFLKTEYFSINLFELIISIISNSSIKNISLNFMLFKFFIKLKIIFLI